MIEKGTPARRLVTAVFATTALLAAAACGGGGGGGAGGADSSGEKVNFFAVRDPQNSTQLAVANKLGYLKDAGLDVDIHWVTSFSDLYAPAGAGEIDFTVASVNNALKWRKDNIPMHYMSILTDSAGGQGLVVNPKVVKKPADLLKVKIGMSKGATVELAMRNFAKQHNINPDDLDYIDLQPPDELSEFDRGGIGAIAAWQPWISRATSEEFGGKLYFTGKESFIPGEAGPVNWLTLPSGVFVNDELIKSRPKVAQAMLKALIKGGEYAQDHPKKAAKLIADDLKVPEEILVDVLPTNVYSAVIDKPVVDGINSIEDFLIETKVLEARIPWRDLFIFDALDEVAPEKLEVKD